MTLQELKTLVATVDVSKFPAPLQLRVIPPRYWRDRADRAYIGAVIKSPERETGSPGEFETIYPIELTQDDATIRRQVVDHSYMACLGILEHELREAFEVNGVRVFDPHLFRRKPFTGYNPRDQACGQHPADRHYLPCHIQPGRRV